MLEIDKGIAALAEDRIHGSGYLARKALGILQLSSPSQRAEVGQRLVEVRPDLLAIQTAVSEALKTGDVLAVIRRSDAERRRVARAATRAISGHRVATISNSALVARALIYASPRVIEVVVEGPDDEGHVFAADLGTSRRVETITLGELQAEMAVVGCDALFGDGSFTARRGTAALVERLPTLLLVDSWKWRAGAPPADVTRRERQELVRGERVEVPGWILPDPCQRVR